MFKLIIIVFAVLVIIVVIQFIRLYGVFDRGNRKQYNVEFVKREPINQLDGLTILYLGSSVMIGMEAYFMSFADYIAKRHDVKTLKVCTSGTTLADISKRSYIARLKQVDKGFRPDYVMVQLSTNDARRKIPLGAIASDYNYNQFDTKTSTGAIEYIIMYCHDHFDCPVIFYTGAKFESANFEQIVKRLIELQDKHDFEIIDMYHDEEFNSITPEERKLYMNDGYIHPTKAGYLLWWTPYIEQAIIQIIEKRA